jgi:hypothetical protein
VSTIRRIGGLDAFGRELWSAKAELALVKGNRSAAVSAELEL